MLNSKSKRAGFFGTLCFHVGVLLFAFFSSVGYTSVEVPIGIEIEFVSYQELNPMEERYQKIDNETLDQSEIDNDNIIEEIILDEDETIHIPNNEDTLTLSKANDVNELFSISSELENALSKIDENIFTDSLEKLDNNNDNIKTKIENSNSVIDDTQDGYILSDNRLAVRKIKPKYSCEEFGKVIVRVWVNREGITIKAEPGIRGTTESASCLLKEAKDAALKTTWTPYFNAPEIQIGQITYNFHKY